MQKNICLALIGGAALAGLAILPGAAQQRALPPVPPPQNVPAPGPQTSAPYAPLTILPGGIVMPLFPAGSPYLNAQKVTVPEVYNMDARVQGRINSIVSIHNPSIEVHFAPAGFNNGTAVILAAGGGHNTLNVGSEAADFVPWLYNHGMTAIILRNRLRRDGYNPKTDEVYDAQQAIRLVRAHAKEWNIDPSKIGIVGFSAGAELSAPAAIAFDEFDSKNNAPSDPLAGVSSRPDFVGLVYPGPSPFVRGAKPPIPKNAPPAFIVCAGWGDKVHAVWSDEYFSAMMQAGIPNVEMHIYARGHHPGDRIGPDEPVPTAGLGDKGGIAFGTWPDRMTDWMHDIGLFNKPGVVTQAAKDVDAFVKAPPPPAR